MELLTTPQEGIDIAKEIGFPVIIKASAGGGGKGMRVVWNESEFLNAFQTAGNEAESFFSNPAVYIEKYIEKSPAHRDTANGG